MSFLTYDTADDIITSLEIIEKLLFPETDFWRDNYFNDDNIVKVKKIVLENRRVGIRDGRLSTSLMSRLNTLWFIFWVWSESRQIRIACLHIPAWLWLNFWIKTKQKSLLSHRIRQIWLPVTYSCFQNSNICSGECAISWLRP